MNKFNIFHSIPEAMTYFLLILVMILNIVGLAINVNLGHRLDNGVNQIERQQNCIAAFFLQPNRAGLTLTNLGVCGNVINGIKH